MCDYLPVNGGGFGGDMAGAFGGALIGGLFGDWFGGNGWNRNGGVSEGVSTTILNDGINAIQNSINQVGQNLSSGLCNLGYQNLDQNSRTNIAMLQGFNQLGRDACTSTASIVSAVNGVGSQMQDCCCATQRLIEREACATRELIQSLNTQNIRDKLCDAKAENAALKANAFTAGALQNAVTTIIQHLPKTTATAAAQ